MKSLGDGGEDGSECRGSGCASSVGLPRWAISCAWSSSAFIYWDQPSDRSDRVGVGGLTRAGRRLVPTWSRVRLRQRESDHLFLAASARLGVSPPSRLLMAACRCQKGGRPSWGSPARDMSREEYGVSSLAWCSRCHRALLPTWSVIVICR